MTGEETQVFLKSSNEWYKDWKKMTGLVIMFPMGWEYPRNVSWDIPITWKDFLKKVNTSDLGVEYGN